MAVKASIPKGTRDFLPLDVLRREHVIAVIREVYQRHGFEPLETPSIENIETLTGKYGEEGEQLIFKILKRGAKAATGECDLGLRYDLTVPLARVAAMYQHELPRIFKRYQIQPVWRADRPGKGRFREFYQCDIDVVGAKSELAEIDVLAAVAEVFARLGFDDAALRLNDRRILRALIEVSGVPRDLEVTALVAIDKLDKIGPEGVRRELDKRGVALDAAESLMDQLESLSNTSEGEMLEALRVLFAEIPEGLAGVEALAAIRAGLSAYGVATERLQVDPWLARGLGYYTGPIFEVAVPDLAGSLGGGGRYDGLIGMFLGRDIPAVGGSLGLERILVVMAEREMFPDWSSRCDVMMSCFGSRSREASLALVSGLREAGYRVDLYPQKDKLGKQFKYADQRNIPFVLVLGPEELEAGQVTVKTMATGDQSVVPRDALVAWMKEQHAAGAPQEFDG